MRTNPSPGAGNIEFKTYTKPMNSKPKSPYEKTRGMIWFPRMLDKIRLHSKDQLHPDFHQNMGRPMCADGFCCGYLRVPYDHLRKRALAGGTDEDILQWCFDNGRKLDEADIIIWNEFIRKLGWNDMVTPMLQSVKATSGLAHRNDILTMPEYMEVDEGRKA
jgi:hypothetical protein